MTFYCMSIKSCSRVPDFIGRVQSSNLGSCRLGLGYLRHLSSCSETSLRVYSRKALCLKFLSNLAPNFIYVSQINHLKLWWVVGRFTESLHNFVFSCLVIEWSIGLHLMKFILLLDLVIFLEKMHRVDAQHLMEIVLRATHWQSLTLSHIMP